MPAFTPSHPIVILIRGLPGSGKSYLAHRLFAALGGDAAVLLDPDATDYDSPKYHAHVKAQELEGVDPALHAYRFLRAKAYQGIEDDKVIIWNQPFTNLEIFNKMTDRLRTHAAEHGKTLTILVVEVSVDPAVAKTRVDQRKRAGGHGPSDATFERFIGDYHSFADHGYDVVSISGQEDVAASVATLLAALEQKKRSVTY